VTKNGLPVDRKLPETTTLTLMSHTGSGAKGTTVHRQPHGDHKVSAAGTERRGRDAHQQQQELPIGGQPPVNSAAQQQVEVKSYKQNVDGTYTREKITTLASSAYAAPAEFQDRQTSRRLATAHIFATKQVANQTFSVATGECLRCGLAQNAPNLLVNSCFDTRAFPVAPEILVKYYEPAPAEVEDALVDGNQ